MKEHTSILCPVDFSDASRGALRYAAAIARHFGARLITLTVENPLLTEALDLGTGIAWTPEDSRRELVKFVAGTFDRRSTAPMILEHEVAVGKPADEILRIARERPCDLIVISSHGMTGVRKLFFGSTTERVLRGTLRPVLITPATDPGPVAIEDATTVIRHVLAPVDLSDASLHQVQAARAVSQALDVPLLLAHVIEPIRSRFTARLHMPGLDAERRSTAEEALDGLVATLPRRLRPEALIAYGDPAEEIAKLIQDRHVGLVVMGLHASPRLGPRMGSVTYRVLCLAPALVLAVPPAAAGAESRAADQNRAVAL